MVTKVGRGGEIINSNLDMGNENKTDQKKPDESDFQERVDGFNKDLSPILAKHELGLTALPQLTRDGRIIANYALVSMRGIDRSQLKKAGDQGQQMPSANTNLDNPDA